MFGSVGILLFPDIDEFSSYRKAFNYLFEASLGGFDSSIFDSMSTKPPLHGYAFHNVFLIVNLVLLLNLLIAILSSTYHELQHRSKALYYNELAKLNSSLQWYAQYGSVISSIPVVDLCLIPFIPFLMKSRSPKRLNDILYMVEYLPIMALAMIIFIVIEIILTPFAIICSIITKISILVTRKNKNKLLSLRDLILYMLFCIPLQIF